MEDEGRCASREFERCGPLHKLVLHYVHTLIVVLSQSGACKSVSHHTATLLSLGAQMSQDCARSSEIESTQEFLSQMLGVNRGSANEAARALQRARLIS